MITTQNGYEQVPVQEKTTYQGKEYRTKELEADRWVAAGDGKQVLYMPDPVRCFEHQGKIAITEKDGDICIPDLSYVVSIEEGRLEVFGDVSDSRLFLNRKRLADSGGVLGCRLAAGDQILIETVLIVYYDGFIEVFSDTERTEISLAECDPGKKPLGFLSRGTF